MKPHKLFTLTITALAVCTASHAVTLGDVRVNSYLSQPLDAEIDIVNLAPGQQADLRLRIANQSYFERMGIPYDAFLRELRFDVVRSGTQWLVRARSERPVREPFIEFPLQMTWPGGHLVRQYTLLFDPPRRVKPARVASVNRTTSPAATGDTARTEPGVDTYGPVRSGETLWPIAQKVKPRGITTRQMMMALLRANPEAFVDGNINALRAGATLRIPLRAFIEQLDKEAARVAFAEELRRWQTPPTIGTSPRAIERVDEPSPEAVVQTPPTADTGEGVINEAPLEALRVEDQLRIVAEPEKPDTEVESTGQDLKEQLLVTMEEIETNRLTTGAMESRLARLEEELQRMQKLIQLKDTQIRALQSEVSAIEATREAADSSQTAAATRGAPQRPDDRQASGDSAPSPAAAEPGRAPLEVTTDTPVVRSDARADQPRSWVLWAVLGVLGLAALAGLWLRSMTRPLRPEDVPLSQRPELKAAKPAPYAVAKPVGGPEADSQPTAPGEPDQAHTAAAMRAGDRDAEIADVLESVNLDETLDEMLDDNKRLTLPTRPGGSAAEPEYQELDALARDLGIKEELLNGRGEGDEVPLLGDDEIPEFLTELDDQIAAAGSEASEVATDEVLELPDATAAETLGDDEDIPGILGELEDQLARPGPGIQPPGVHVARNAAEIHEDETFSMSLDLARAYLEIGDEDGAKDMLEQALSGAQDPDHQKQIKELLQQIG